MSPNTHRAAFVLLSMAVIVVGLIWTFQGLGYWEGSAMTGQDEWAVIGPAVAGLGVALLIVVTRPRR
jgi:hypothetical protein